MYSNKSNNPFAELKPIRSMFDELINEGLSSVLGAGLATSSPQVNIVENDDKFVIELAAPGVEKSDFSLNLNQNTLTVSLKKKSDENLSDKTFIRREYRLTSFDKSFEISDNVDRQGILASYENGVLFVSLPKLQKDETEISRNIEIQ